MKKTYKIDVDCANCANLMEQAAKKTAGVKDATVSFMSLKMTVEFEEGAEPAKVMKDVLKADFIEKHGKPDVIILDPPRAGIHPDVARVILEAAPQRMVYVSCNPASQARDLAILCRDYEITAVQPVDMFPHTMHVENVVALRRKN